MERDSRTKGHTYLVYVFCFQLPDLHECGINRRGGDKRECEGGTERMSKWRHTRASVLGRPQPHTLLSGRLSQATPRELPRKHAAGVGSRTRQGLRVGTLLASPACHPCSLGTLGEPWGGQARTAARWRHALASVLGSLLGCAAHTDHLAPKFGHPVRAS